MHYVYMGKSLKLPFYYLQQMADRSHSFPVDSSMEDAWSSYYAEFSDPIKASDALKYLTLFCVRMQMSEIVERQFQSWHGVHFMLFDVPVVDIRGE